LGKLSIKKRPNYKEKLKEASLRRWQNYVHPKQDALLELAKREDLTKLNMSQIAQKLGIEGKHPNLVVKRLVTKLQYQGLLQPGVGRAYSHISRDLIELAKTVDVSELSYEEIAQKLGMTGKWRAQNVGNSLRRLMKKGLIMRDEGSSAVKIQYD
jgi:hypothetical protein